MSKKNIGIWPKRPAVFHCQICNDKNAKFIGGPTNSVQTKSFINVILQYTAGTPPCVKCVSTWTAYNHQSKSEKDSHHIDRWICNKILRGIGFNYNALEKRTTKDYKKKAKDRQTLRLQTHPDRISRPMRKRILTEKQHIRSKFMKKYNHRRKVNAKIIKTNIERFENQIVRNNECSFIWKDDNKNSSTSYKGCVTNNMFFANRLRKRSPSLEAFKICF